ncbi:uncharacterized protein EV154DRAFT_514276 [Mucor mucedo]|uniref:uncharacterized protein n=1 Tax=Mucor mucedo TaxID=29922 RepID=UPI00222055BC|nr:uncharacterized protein EV154DRAFT_514276 [Mucor mucedo]KAI7889608.1 hypothetical protein EV154DRAFT_514276 [Mucor mucedo]
MFSFFSSLVFGLIENAASVGFRSGFVCLSVSYWMHIVCFFAHDTRHCFKTSKQSCFLKQRCSFTVPVSLLWD